VGPPCRNPRRLWVAWIVTLLWLGVIAVESTDLFSSAKTGQLLYSFLTALFGKIDLQRFLVWHAFLRKGGHVVGYGLLSFLLFRAWRETLTLPFQPRWTLRWATAALLGTALVAILDEWHQSYLPSRTGRASDVLLDTFAGLIVQLVLWRTMIAFQRRTLDVPIR
jgi:VanZ family protein